MIQDNIQQKTDELQKNIDELQKKIDELQKKIDELPVKCYDNINDKEINNYLVCPIGLGFISQPYSIKCCGTYFCRKCIDDWL